MPGVQGDRFTEQGGGTSFGRTGGVNVHGARSLQNNFLLDGVDNNSISENVQELTTQVSRPSVDAIQEFKVVTSPYSAEYGRSPGAAISVTTKSGTNEIHGTAYDYYRNERFDSNDFFSKRANLPKPANDQNQFGGNLGGPIVKDKAFFFADYEGTRITRGVTRITRVPTADERAGHLLVAPCAIRSPASPSRATRIPAEPHRPVRRRRSSALVPAAEPAGREQLLRASADIDRQLRPLPRPRSTCAPTDNDNVFARYIYSNRNAQHPRRLRRRRRRHRHLGLRRPDDQDATRWSAGWTRIFSPDGRQRVPLLVVAGRRPTRCSSPSASSRRPARDDSRARHRTRWSRAACPGITIDGYFGGSGLGRIGSPDFLPKFQHTNQFEFIEHAVRGCAATTRSSSAPTSSRR